MSMTSLRMMSGSGESMDFPINDPRAPYILKKITGTDPDDLTPKFYGFSIDADTKFYDLGLKPRQVSFLIQLNPRFNLGETHKSLRDSLYKKILQSRGGSVDLLFFDGPSAQIKATGFITKFEAPLITKTPTVQITVLCNDPMLRGTTLFRVEEDELNTAYDSDWKTFTIVDSLSNAPHGFQMQITAVASFVGWLLIQDHPTDPTWKFTIEPHQFGFEGTDIYFFSSEFRDRDSYMTRSLDGTPDIEYLMDVIYPDSTWPIIFPGSNTFYLSCEGSDNADFNVDYVEYTAAYWGL